MSNGMARKLEERVFQPRLAGLLFKLLSGPGRDDRSMIDDRDTAREAHDILAANLSEDHWRVAMAASAEGAALTGLGDFAAAEPLLVHSNEVLSQGGAAMALLSEQSQERLDELYAVWQK